MASALKEYKDSQMMDAVWRCVEAAEKNPKFAADHYRGALSTLRVRHKTDIGASSQPPVVLLLPASPASRPADLPIEAL